MTTSVPKGMAIVKKVSGEIKEENPTCAGVLSPKNEVHHEEDNENSSSNEARCENGVC